LFLKIFEKVSVPDRRAGSALLKGVNPGSIDLREDRAPLSEILQDRLRKSELFLMVEKGSTEKLPVPSWHGV
jgi:hypothetical protein